MNDRALNDYLNAMVSHVMEKNVDAISDAYWAGGMVRVTFEDGDLVVKPVSPEEMYVPLPDPGKMDDGERG